MSSTTVCRNCEATKKEEMYFCAVCGTRVCGTKVCGTKEGGALCEHQDDGTRYYHPLFAPGRARLTMIRTTGEKGEFHLGDRVARVGRLEGSIVFENDKYLSPSHAEFRYEEEGLVVEDLGSLNGTYIKRKEMVVRDKPVYMVVGEQTFRVELIKNLAMKLDEGGTLDFVSPLFDYKFRVVHVLEGGEEGASICSPSNHVVIGRTNGDFKVASDTYLSPRHVLVREEGREIVIHDIDSKNGTFFRIEKPTHLNHGDYVLMGNEIFRVEINS